MIYQGLSPSLYPGTAGRTRTQGNLSSARSPASGSAGRASSASCSAGKKPTSLSTGAGRSCCRFRDTGHQQKKQICRSHNISQKCWWDFHQEKFASFLQIRAKRSSSGSQAASLSAPAVSFPFIMASSAELPFSVTV